MELWSYFPPLVITTMAFKKRDLNIVSDACLLLLAAAKLTDLNQSSVVCEIKIKKSP